MVYMRNGAGDAYFLSERFRRICLANYRVLQLWKGVDWRSSIEREQVK